MVVGSSWQWLAVVAAMVVQCGVCAQTVRAVCSHSTFTLYTASVHGYTARGTGMLMGLAGLISLLADGLLVPRIRARLDGAGAPLRAMMAGGAMVAAAGLGLLWLAPAGGKGWLLAGPIGLLSAGTALFRTAAGTRARAPPWPPPNTHALTHALPLPPCSAPTVIPGSPRCSCSAVASCRDDAAPSRCMHGCIMGV